MHPATQRFIDVLTEDVDRWEKAAADVEAMLSHIPEPDREHWRETAKGYRAWAARYKSMIRQAKEDADAQS